MDHIMKQVPQEFFKENFWLDKKFFNIKAQHDAQHTNDNLTKSWEIVETNLVESI
jgi:hypothetical protein